MNSISDIINQYKRLSLFCENFWNTVYKSHSKEIACHAGCGICCELQSVNILEAYCIYRQIVSDNRFVSDQPNEKCVFLKNNLCQIYSVRPIICRTHGLPIRSTEFTTEFSITCPYNFYDKDTEISPECILDMDRITENSIRLNYAFCLLHGIKERASERIFLTDIAVSNLDKQLQPIFNRPYE